MSAAVLAKRVRAILSLDAREHLRRCSPVLYIAGSHDEVVPRHNVEGIVCVRPSVHVRTIEGRHFAMYTNPKGAADVITEFIAQRESP